MYVYIDLVRQGSNLDLARWRDIDVTPLYIVGRILLLLVSFV